MLINGVNYRDTLPYFLRLRRVMRKVTGQYYRRVRNGATYTDTQCLGYAIRCTPVLLALQEYAASNIQNSETEFIINKAIELTKQPF